jgi:hypothetical protein
MSPFEDATETAERRRNRLIQLMDELDEYLPESIRNQPADGPIGPGTLKGFHAKAAQLFLLGTCVGWDKAINHKKEEDDTVPVRA